MTRPFAWDGVAFSIPEHWDLAEYSVRKEATRIEFEDEYAIRLQAEWVQPRHRSGLDKIRNRFSRDSEQLEKRSESSHSIDLAEPGWSAFCYTMPDGIRVVNMFYLGITSRIFAYFHIYFHPTDGERTTDVATTISRTFCLHTGPTRPWHVYDINVELPTPFKLLSTAFHAGRKLMVFHWRLRKFYIWHLSPAELLLKNTSAEQWGADFLNQAGLIPGPVFSAGRGGCINTARGRRYRLGHFDEIGRWCFGYRAGIRHNAEQNQLVLWVFNYRREDDLKHLPQAFR